MPLDKATANQLKENLKKARNKHMQFFYCKSGPDDEPVLLVAKRVQSEGNKLKKKAKKKQFVTGAVHFDKTEQVLAFVTTTPKAHQFEKNLRLYFAKAPGLQQLKKAKVITPEEDQESTATDASPESVDPGKSTQSDANEENMKMWRSIQKYQDVFLADPTQAPDKLVAKLSDRLSAYDEAGGSGDFSELAAAMAQEKIRRPAGKELTKTLTALKATREQMKASFDGLKDLNEDTVTKRKTLIKELKGQVSQLRSQRDAYAKIIEGA